MLGHLGAHHQPANNSFSPTNYYFLESKNKIKTKTKILFFIISIKLLIIKNFVIYGKTAKKNNSPDDGLVQEGLEGDGGAHRLAVHRHAVGEDGGLGVAEDGARRGDRQQVGPLHLHLVEQPPPQLDHLKTAIE